MSTVDLFTRHRGPVTSVATVPHTRSIVTAAYDSAVALCSLDTTRMELLGYHRHLVNKVIVNPAGTRAASCSSDYTVRIWDLATRRCERQLLGHSDDAEDFAFVDDVTGVSASRDRRILVWDLRTGAIRHVMEHDKDVLALAFHDGRLFSSGDDKTLRVWDVATGRCLRVWGPFDHETDTCSIDAQRGRVILGCDDGVVRLFDVESGDLVTSLAAHSSGIKKVATARNGDFLSAAYDQKIIVWAGDTLEQRLVLDNVPTKWERSFTWSDDATRIYAGTFDGTILEWDATTGRCLRELGRGPEDRGNACFNRVAGTAAGAVAAVSDDGYVRLAEVTEAGARFVSTHEPRSGRMLMNAVAIDAQQRMVVSGAHDQKLHIFRLADHELDGEVEVALGEGPINSIAISTHPDTVGESFVACYSGAVCRVTPRGDVRARLRVHEGAVKAVRLHPTRALGVSCAADGTLRSWSFDGQIIERYLGHTAIINDVDLDPAGERVASVSRDFTLKIYDLASGRLQESVALGRRSLKSVCFVSGGVVLVGDYWGYLHRVELGSGAVMRKRIARNGISSLTRAESLVSAASYDGRIYAVRPATLECVHAIEAMRQRFDEGDTSWTP